MKLFNNIKKKLAGFLIAACVSTAFFGSFTPVYAADRVYATADCNAAYNSTIDNWFSDTVFIGDSLMQGFRSYAALHGGSWMDRLGFLCTANFSSFNAFNSDIIQPMYMGQRTRVWEGVKLMNARRIFICLGLNDINMGSLDECIASYEKFVGRILEDNPGIEVNIISMTYAYPGVQSQNIYNPTIASYNSMLNQMAAKHGWGWVNLADPLSDGNGNLSKAYCSDNYFHHNSDGYKVWCDVLRQYAADRMGLGVKLSKGEWRKSGDSVYYQYSDGILASGGWHWIDENNDGYARCYYFTKDGTLLQDDKTPDGYSVTSDGEWIMNSRIRTEKVAVYG